MGFFNKLFGTRKVKQPEEFYSVIITDESIVVEHPKRKTEKLDWNDLKEIKLINTDEGPFAPDVWLILMGNDTRCSIPQGSEGYDVVYEIVSKYDGFNFENVIASMSCADNAQFELWKRD